MTDLSLRHRIFAIIAFSFSALVLSYRSYLLFTLIFFACIGLVLFFADRLVNSEKIKERTAFVFFVSAACYQTFYQIFNRVHENNKQLITAAALALFLAAVLAATDQKKLPYCIIAALTISFLDTGIGAAFCILLLSFSIVKLKLLPKGNKSKKSPTKNKSTNPDTFSVLVGSIMVSLCCLAYSVYQAIKNTAITSEQLDYIFTYFKNTLGFSVVIVYFVIKIMRSNIKAKSFIIAGIVLHIALIPLYWFNYGWAFTSLFIISMTLFLGLVCLENNNIIDSIKNDYRNHRYLFLVGLLCLLQ
ncbi:MAG: hypothetical protein IIX16_02860 [Clostridia bacterium]|nr:hypothetical protein [Clostridia bacterium]